MLMQWVVLLLVLAMIAADHFVVWQAFIRQSRVDATRARHTLWLRGALLMWAASTIVLWLWISTGVPMSSIGFSLPVGWRLWTPLAATISLAALQIHTAIRLARRPVPSEMLRAQLQGAAAISPRTASELPAFFGASVTAGICEELLFRGFLIWVLRPLVGLWLAAALSALLFGAAHAYQGPAGVIRTGLFGLIFTAIVLLTRSLWPAIVLHAIVDALGGVIAWLALRDTVPASAAAEASSP